MQSLLLLSAVAPLVFYIFHAHFRKRPSDVICLTTADGIHKLLQDNISKQLRARASPNERLLRAFNITGSTFTSPCVDIHQGFKRDSLRKLRIINFKHNGERIRDDVDKVIQAYLFQNSNLLEYDAFIQSVTFVAVLIIFFDHSATSIPELSDVKFVTQSINILWVASKKIGFEGDPNRLDKVNNVLKKLIPTSTSDPFRGAPLELILPAYETLWRVVAHAFPYVWDNEGLTQSFKRLYADPAFEQFNSPNGRGISAHNVVQEVLRLHPPTKRIKRVRAAPPSLRQGILSTLGIKGKKRNVIFSLDIESLQQSAVWDPLPHEFCPERHRTLSAQQRLAYMPFGAGTLKCIAYSDAPYFTGIILACLAKTDEISIVKGENKGDREGWKGWKIQITE